MTGSSSSTRRWTSRSSRRRYASATTAGSTTTSSATADSARDLGASNLLLYEAASWGQEQGLDEFHLGGGAGSEEDSLLAFKQRFSPDGAREFWVGKLVHDEDAYRRLSGGAEIDYDGFFPAYRA